MAFQDFFNGRRLSIADFTTVELNSILNVCNPLYDYISFDPARVRPNTRPTTWNIHKSQLYICYIATKGINHPAFAKVASLHQLISSLLFLNDTNDTDWDFNKPVVTAETLRIMSDIETINGLIATKTFEYLDNAVWDKHIGIKNDIEFINNALTETTYRYKYMVTVDKVDGYHSTGLSTIMQPLVGLINATFAAAAPYTLLFQGLMLAIDDFSTPNGKTVATQRLAEYERLKIKINGQANEMSSVQTRINNDGYNYDFVNLEVIKFEPKGKGGQPQTPATFTAKANPDGTITVQGITSGDIVSIDGVAGTAAVSNTFTSIAQKDGQHKVTINGIGLFSYAETVTVTTKASLLSAPLTFIQNNAKTAGIVVFVLIVLYVFWKRGTFSKA